jgi:hypothetical protein
VTEREELVGRFRTVSRLPQYFTTAIFTGAVVLDLYIVGKDAIVLLQCFDYIQSNFSGDVSSSGYLTLNSNGWAIPVVAPTLVAACPRTIDYAILRRSNYEL